MKKKTPLLTECKGYERHRGNGALSSSRATPHFVQSLETRPFSTDSFLPGGWRVVTYVPKVRLALIRRGQHELKVAARKGMVMVCALILIAVLALDSFHTSVHFMWAMMPVIVLLAVVVVFGAMGAFSALRRAFAPAHLVVDAEKGEVSGFVSHHFWPRLRSEPLQKLQALVLEVRRGAGNNPKDLKTWATLELKLEDGTRLEAPDAWGPDAEFEATEALLIPLGQTLSSLSQKPLEITRLGFKESAGAVS